MAVAERVSAATYERERKRREATRLKASGYSCRQIAELFGISHETARHWSNPEVRAKDLAKRRGYEAAERACQSPLCMKMIPADAFAKKLFCCRSCQMRTAYMRRIGMA